MAAEAPLNAKILLIGNSSVGKSSILLRFSDETWLSEDESSATIGVDFRVSKMEVRGKKVKLSIWDTAGQERFRTITSSYYRGAQGIILVYDVANRESFEALPKWFSELERMCPQTWEQSDKEFSRQVTTEEGKAFAERMGTLFVECSAKTKVGVRDTFRELVEKIVDTPELWAPAQPKVGVAAAGNSTRVGGDELFLDQSTS
ncbi:Rab subfamily of small GTPases [Rhizoctonia solani]|uniref:Rab subfamily of small GTPases n=1 Tax=Rhizoctonia solani TaxID=456999 RepID=A0A8H7I9S3_9AGAM|nr:Rab subfamily of small GTPases [Rhizoctonia solani]